MKQNAILMAVMALSIFCQNGLHAARQDDDDWQRRITPSPQRRMNAPRSPDKEGGSLPRTYSHKNRPKFRDGNEAGNEVTPEIQSQIERNRQRTERLKQKDLQPTRARDEFKKFFERQQKVKADKRKPGSGTSEYNPFNNPRYLQKRNKDTAQQIQRKIRKSYPQMPQWFSWSFFHQHDYMPVYFSHRNWWHPIYWNQVATWLAWGSISPIYYDDIGEAQTIPYDYSQDVSFYDNDSRNASEDSWLPLGIFAIAPSENEMETASSFYQLALNRNGSIAGTYYNATNNAIHPLEGMVDQETQQVAWRVSDNPYSPILTTGLYNFTQNIVPIMIHFSPDNSQNWLMVRMQE